MFGIGTGELLLLLVLALLVLGPERMPRLARDIGKTVGDLRRTSDELRQEFLSADAVIDRAAQLGEPPTPAAPLEVGAISAPAEQPASDPLPELVAESLDGGAAEVAPAEPAVDVDATQPSEAGATQADLAAPEPDETVFDRDARLARERLDDPARAERAKAEGWTVPTDEAGANSDKWS